MYLTIIRTPYDPESQDSGEMTVGHLPLPRPKLVKGGDRNAQIRRDTYTKFVSDELIDKRNVPRPYAEVIIDWLMVANPADNMNLLPAAHCDATVLILHEEGEPTDYVARTVTEPRFVLHDLNQDGEWDEEEEDEEDEDEKPSVKPKKKR